MKNLYEITIKEKKDGFYHLHGMGCKKSLGKAKKYNPIGVHDNSLDAFIAARKIYPNIKPCVLCCPECFEFSNERKDEK